MACAIRCSVFIVVLSAPLSRRATSDCLAFNRLANSDCVNPARFLASIIAEAISNSWDADASNVWIYIKKEDDGKDKIFIKDDGIGMDDSDFQDKFLKIGYSKKF